MRMTNSLTLCIGDNNECPQKKKKYYWRKTSSVKGISAHDGVVESN